jgi:hypothetical protein
VPDPEQRISRAIEVHGLGNYGVEDCLIQKNLIRLDYASPIEWFGSGVKTFDNNSLEGQLMLASQTVLPYLPAPELVIQVKTSIEDALLASHFN